MGSPPGCVGGHVVQLAELCSESDMAGVVETCIAKHAHAILMHPLRAMFLALHTVFREYTHLRDCGQNLLEYLLIQ